MPSLRLKKLSPLNNVAVHPYKKDLQETWKSFKRMFRKSAIIRNTTALSVLFLLGTILLPVWRILPLIEETPYIALHYNIYLGVDRFGPLYQIFFLPGLGLLFLLLNLFIEARAYRQQKTLSLFFAAATPLLECILFIAMVLIVLINV